MVERRYFGLRRGRPYWVKRARRRNAIFVASLLFGLAWMVFSVWLSLPWLTDLGNLTHPLLALAVLTFIAYLPGFMNAFLLSSLVLRPSSLRETPIEWPGVSVLVAAYNEEATIAATLQSLSQLDYAGPVEVIVIDDGSRDRTFAIAESCASLFAGQTQFGLKVVRMARNGGKAAALNHGLKGASHELIVTIDADTLLDPDALRSVVEHLYAAPPQTAAVAGSVLVANAMATLTTKVQQWDYFHGIAAVKRMQGMFNSTLVAQGAFSLYRKAALTAVGGWPDMVGEDIVLTWSLLREGYRVRHAEDAVAWTHAPEGFSQLAKQRRRWARGMIEALNLHKSLLLKPRIGTMFIHWNLLFIAIDVAFTFAFLPGLVLAALGIYWLAGPITLLVLPIAALWNIIIYRIQSRMLKKEGITYAKSALGFLVYAFAYTLVMQPVSVWGYMSEFFGRKKQWG
ncbi:glycosyltransferase [Erythrobacter neustonensis]|uniref:glycosyltransferase n=1 Tax=Erythrobacter neustonensis TaxID=1112 RepID=UPI000ADE2336|nr:glycosyltransferase [Erythrobacter neustonensis]